jgi:hypothetical protein
LDDQAALLPGIHVQRFQTLTFEYTLFFLHLTRYSYKHKLIFPFPFCFLGKGWKEEMLSAQWFRIRKRKFTRRLVHSRHKPMI